MLQRGPAAAANRASEVTRVATKTGKGHVEPIPSSYGPPDLPHPVEQRLMAEALPRPVAQVGDRLCCRRN